MELNIKKLTQDQFVECFLTDMDASIDENFNEVEQIETINNNMTDNFENEGESTDLDASMEENYNEVEHMVNSVKNNEKEGINPMKGKAKRRSNLTEFGSDQSAKRKNETAKRELTSIVKQLGKIDKQLNTKNESRVSINFVANFTTFNSNRQCTFSYPSDARVKQTLLDHDTTILAVKNAVKDAWIDLTKGLHGKERGNDITISSTANEVLTTPTKTISAFTAFPSPVTVKGQPISAKNLCAKNSCTFGKKLKNPVWIKCCHRNEEGQQCSYWVHAPCIGFPSLKAGDAKVLEGWCCPDHTDMLIKRK